VTFFRQGGQIYCSPPAHVVQVNFSGKLVDTGGVNMSLPDGDMHEGVKVTLAVAR
jgi:hypothetical protein